MAKFQISMVAIIFVSDNETDVYKCKISYGIWDKYTGIRNKTEDFRVSNKNALFTSKIR